MGSEEGMFSLGRESGQWGMERMNFSIRNGPCASA